MARGMDQVSMVFPYFRISALLNLATLASLALVLSACATDTATSNVEWTAHGATAHNTKYLPLDQIDKGNVGDLHVAWEWLSVDEPIEKSERRYSVSAFQGTPLYIGGLLYTSTSMSQVAAIDPATGKTLWVHDPESYKAGRPLNWGFINRGLAYWTDGIDKRLFIGTGDGRLIAVDAATGKPCANFGTNGSVDTKDGLTNRELSISSPPVVCRDIVVVGSNMPDAARTQRSPAGMLKAYDVRTGERRWTFNIIPRKGEFGYDTWQMGSADYTGHANAWSIMSADEELGYIYVPTSTPTNDYYGGHRPGDGLFGESILCLNAETGERIWHYQTVHHGLWDFDLPAAPILCNITVDGKSIDAAVQIAKQGFCFVFDRKTGKPVWPIEEREVPGSDTPGERPSPTQPFPTKPPPFERQGLAVEDLIDFTPELRAQALEWVKPFRMGPLYTPASVEGTIQVPGTSGGANWQGAAFDPDTGILYIPSISSFVIVKLVKPDPARSDLSYIGTRANKIEAAVELPIFKPPYGRITAIDLNRGELLWQVARGDGPRDHPLLKDLDLPPLGQNGRAGPVLTKTLLFVADGTVSNNSSGRMGGGTMFRAYDKATGETVWEKDLGVQASGTPMTYMHDGKQYIVIATKDREHPARLIALSLP